MSPSHGMKIPWSDMKVSGRAGHNSVALPRRPNQSPLTPHDLMASIREKKPFQFWQEI